MSESDCRGPLVRTGLLGARGAIRIGEERARAGAGGRDVNNSPGGLLTRASSLGRPRE
ncbi:MAG: hypothetical protein HC888_19190 [Candidatus Competibacteraceae bacterium]|nr:hypothetical protein [Candidatus Competibacteraceae bacterium]